MAAGHCLCVEVRTFTALTKWRPDAARVAGGSVRIETFNKISQDAAVHNRFTVCPEGCEWDLEYKNKNLQIDVRVIPVNWNCFQNTVFKIPVAF